MDEKQQQSGLPSVPSVDPVHLRKVWNFMRDHGAFDQDRALGRRLVELEFGSVGEWGTPGIIQELKPVSVSSFKRVVVDDGPQPTNPDR